MKRFAVFAFYNYYPSGGWGDFIGSFDTSEEAHKVGLDSERDDYHVIDLTTGEYHDDHEFPV